MLNFFKNIPKENIQIKSPDTLVLDSDNEDEQNEIVLLPTKTFVRSDEERKRTVRTKLREKLRAKSNQ